MCNEPEALVANLAQVRRQSRHGAVHARQAHRIQDDDEGVHVDSASDAASSTASVSSSILEYRTINGRTFHSERHNTEYFTPNDERQTESLDIVYACRSAMEAWGLCADL